MTSTSSTPYNQIRNGHQRTAPNTAPLKLRKGLNGRVRFDLPNFQSLPTLKDLIQSQNSGHLPSYTNKQLNDEFAIHPDIINMTSVTAKDYVFPEPLSQIFEETEEEKFKYHEITFNEDDAFQDNYNGLNDNYNSTKTTIKHDIDTLYDDWGDMEADISFDSHIRNPVKSDNNTPPYQPAPNQNGKGWKDAHRELISLGCDR